MKHIIHKGCKIHYNIKGNGPALMLIHGYTEHQGIWDHFKQQLIKSFTVITPDLPAHGKSEFPAYGLTIEFMADCLMAILKNEKITKATLIGHSMGGYAMLSFAEQYSEFCNGICLFHSTARADSPEIKTNRERTIEIISKNHTGFLYSFIPDLFAVSNRERLQTEIDSLVEKAAEISPEGLAACMEAMKDRQGSIELLALANFPVGFIIGKQDSRVSCDAVLAQSALPKQSHVLILDDCGHMGYLEKPEETLAFIRYFASL